MSTAVFASLPDRLTAVQQFGCFPSRSHLPGTSSSSISNNDATRGYLLHVPPSYNGVDRLPLVINFHGENASAVLQESYTGFSSLADESNFIVVYPEGSTTWLANTSHFNALALPAPEPDDVAFVAQLLDSLESQLCIDEARIYATGISNGAMMATRLACTLSDRIAAVAPVDGLFYPAALDELSGADSCQKGRPVPIIGFHGSADATLPIGGGGTVTISSAPITVAAIGNSIKNTGIVRPLGWVQQVKQTIDAEFETNSAILNVSTNGIRSDQLLDRLRNDPLARLQISLANVVLMEIGYNDFFQSRGSYLMGSCGGSDNQDCLRAMVSSFEANWDGIIAETKSLTSPESHPVALRAIDIYYSVAEVDQIPAPPYNNSFPVLNSYLTQMNQHILQSAAQNGIALGLVHEAFNGPSGEESPMAKGYILSDAVHPTDLGHTAIANAVEILGYEPLSIPLQGRPLNLHQRLPVVNIDASGGDWLSDWAAHNGCAGSRHTSKTGTDLTHISYDGCPASAPVELYVINGGGATWPGAADYSPLGYTTREIDATTTIWHFLQTFSLDSPPPRAYPGDSDGDGCPDAKELQASFGAERTGGLRDYVNPWDFFNPTHDGKNRIDDVLVLLQHYGLEVGDPGYSIDYDRTYIGPNRWNLGPPKGKIKIQDVMAIVAHYGLDCS